MPAVRRRKKKATNRKKKKRTRRQVSDRQRLMRLKHEDLNALLKESGSKPVHKTLKQDKISQLMRTSLGKKLLLVGAVLTPAALGLGARKTYKTILRSKLRRCPFKKGDAVQVKLDVLLAKGHKTSTPSPPSEESWMPLSEKGYVDSVNLLTEKVGFTTGRGQKIQFYKCSDLELQCRFKKGDCVQVVWAPEQNDKITELSGIKDVHTKSKILQALQTSKHDVKAVSLKAAAVVLHVLDYIVPVPCSFVHRCE